MQQLSKIRNSSMRLHVQSRESHLTFDIFYKGLRKSLSMCKTAKVEAMKSNTIGSRNVMTKHVESAIMSRCEIQKSCYNGGDLEGNDIKRIMSKGSIFEDM